MANTKNNNQRFFFYLAALAVVIFFAAYFFYFPDLFLISSGNSDYYFSPSKIIRVDKESLRGLEEFKKCGDWPLNQVSPNLDRGNPFNKKEAPEGIIKSVPEVQCLGVIRN